VVATGGAGAGAAQDDKGLGVAALFCSGRRSESVWAQSARRIREGREEGRNRNQDIAAVRVLAEFSFRMGMSRRMNPEESIMLSNSFWYGFLMGAGLVLLIA
jgi:hypothetical protein